MTKHWRGLPCLYKLYRSVWHYCSSKDDSEVIAKLQHDAELFPSLGFDEYYGKICNAGRNENAL